MKEEIEVIYLDNIKYIISDTITINNNQYVFLANYNNVEDFCVRKKIIEDGKEYLVGLDSKEELDIALIEYTKKHIDDENLE